MELEGAKRCFTYLQTSNVSIGTFITDRHLSITAWMRVSQPNTRHLFDLWHLVKSITKKITKKGKQKGNEILFEWIKGISIVFIGVQCLPRMDLENSFWPSENPH